MTFKVDDRVKYILEGMTLPVGYEGTIKLIEASRNIYQYLVHFDVPAKTYWCNERDITHLDVEAKS